jgi:hypothetical protein
MCVKSNSCLLKKKKGISIRAKFCDVLTYLIPWSFPKIWSSLANQQPQNHSIIEGTCHHLIPGISLETPPSGLAFIWSDSEKAHFNSHPAPNPQDIYLTFQLPEVVLKVQANKKLTKKKKKKLRKSWQIRRPQGTLKISDILLGIQLWARLWTAQKGLKRP